MIHRLKVKNFYSFLGEQEFSLSGMKSTLNDRRFMVTPSGKNIAKVAMIYGANASGKTNFLKAFSFLSWLILYSWEDLSQNDEIIFSPFHFMMTHSTQTEFEVLTESTTGILYNYSIRLTQEKIIHESLRMRPLNSSRFVFLFNRDEEYYKTYASAKFSVKDIPQKALRKNASFISAIKQTDIVCFDDFIDSIHILSNVSTSGRIRDNLQNSFRILSKNKEIKEFVEDQLKKCDFGISKIDIKKRKLSEEEKQEFTKISCKFFEPIDNQDIEYYTAYTFHTVNGTTYKFPFRQESNGTRQALSFLTKTFLALKVGGILIYDEIEDGIHPLLLQSLLELFYDEESNPHGAQLICTCHSTDCMNFLHKRQVFLVEKDENQESSLLRLSDVAGVRNDDNIMPKYLSGAYGGVPCL